MKRLGAVIIVLLLIGVGAFVILPSVQGQNAEIVGDVKVYISRVGNPAEMVAQIAIDDADSFEMMSMGLGSPIRAMSFTPNFTQNVGEIVKTAPYSMYSVATINVHGMNMRSIVSSSVERVAYAGTNGNYGLQNTSYKLGTGSAGGWTTSNNLALDTDVTFRTPVSGVMNTVYIAYPLSQGRTMIGNDLNGATFQLNISVTGIDDGGQAVTITKVATLQLRVTNWQTSGMEIVITSMTATVS